MGEKHGRAAGLASLQECSLSPSWRRSVRRPRCGASSAKSPFPASAPTKAKWNQVIAKAKQGGSVTIYSAQAPTTLAALGAAFKAKYGINVTVNRQVDSVMVQQVTAEQGSNKRVADLWVQASKNYTPRRRQEPLGDTCDRAELLREGVRPQDPPRPRPDPDRRRRCTRDGMEARHVLRPAGMKDMPDFLDSKLTGKIGIPQPTSASFIDWYLVARGNLRQELPDEARSPEGEDLPVVADDDAGRHLW